MFGPLLTIPVGSMVRLAQHHSPCHGRRYAHAHARARVPWVVAPMASNWSSLCCAYRLVWVRVGVRVWLCFDVLRPDPWCSGVPSENRARSVRRHTKVLAVEEG